MKKSGAVTFGQEQAQSPPALPTRAHVMADRVWLVLARRAYDEPLHQVGTIEADDHDLACVYARSIYDEFAWIEMVIVPRDAIVTVIEA